MRNTFYIVNFEIPKLINFKLQINICVYIFDVYSLKNLYYKNDNNFQY